MAFDYLRLLKIYVQLKHVRPLIQISLLWHFNFTRTPVNPTPPYLSKHRQVLWCGGAPSSSAFSVPLGSSPVVHAAATTAAEIRLFHPWYVLAVQVCSPASSPSPTLGCTGYWSTCRGVSCDAVFFFDSANGCCKWILCSNACLKKID